MRTETLSRFRFRQVLERRPPVSQWSIRQAPTPHPASRPRTDLGPRTLKVLVVLEAADRINDRGSLDRQLHRPPLLATWSRRQAVGGSAVNDVAECRQDCF